MNASHCGPRRVRRALGRLAATVNRIAVTAVFVAAGSLSAAPSALAQSGDCDRDCLAALLGRYLDSVVAHDPSKAPLWVGFRQTENARVVRPGAGVWQTVTGLGPLERRYFDPVAGQAAYLGLVKEGAETAIVTLRIGVRGGEIREAEWYIARRGDPGMNGPPSADQRGTFFDPDNLVANPPPERSVPAGQRAPRDVLLAVTNSYFDGITTHDGRVILQEPDCTRIENGRTTVGRHVVPPGGGEPRDTNCGSGLETINIQAVVGRRFPLVDEEAQVVLGTGVFIRRPGTTTRRNCFSELFIIDGARISRIYAAMFYPPPEMLVPNWPPYEGHWPLPADAR
jgi:hypothetical protein